MEWMSDMCEAFDGGEVKRSRIRLSLNRWKKVTSTMVWSAAGGCTENHSAFEVRAGGLNGRVTGIKCRDEVIDLQEGGGDSN